MSSLRVAMVVPRKASPGAVPVLPAAELRRWIARGEVDLVALPEMHISVRRVREVVPVVRLLAEDLGVPVMCGAWAEDAYQCAGYWNPSPRKGETREHFYAKHATSVRLAYDLPDYARLRDAMFEPIALGGRRLALQLCHDMFFGLVTARSKAAGADTYFDLTGSNANLSKWTNVLAARSLEVQAPFFCTMSDWAWQKAPEAVALAYRDGRAVKPARSFGSARTGRLVLFDTSAKGTGAPNEQAFTDKVYTDVRVALGRASSAADIHIDGSGSIQGRPPKHGAWCEQRVRGRRVGVLTLPMTQLRDPLCIHRIDRIDDPFDCHVVAFIGADPSLSPDDVLLLAKLRAIEHRMAIGLLSPKQRELVKTNRYKNIQRFREVDGVFGLDAMFLGGTYAYAQESTTLGLPRKHIASYRALMRGLG